MTSPRPTFIALYACAGSVHDFDQAFERFDKAVDEARQDSEPGCLVRAVEKGLPSSWLPIPASSK